MSEVATRAVKGRQEKGQNVPQPSDSSLRLKRDARKMKAVLLLANGARLTKTMQQIAEEVGVSKQTLYEWLSHEAFVDAIYEATKQTLKSAIPDAYSVLVAALRGPGDVKTKIRAAEILLKATGETIERVEATVKQDAKSVLEQVESEIRSIEAPERLAISA